MHYLIAGLIGLAGGVISGLFGVGGGIVMVPAMVLLLSPPVRDIKQAVGTSLCIIIPTALMGAWKHAQHDNVEWRTALAIAPLAIVGGYLGAWLAVDLSADSLKRGFGVLLVIVGLKFLLGR